MKNIFLHFTPVLFLAMLFGCKNEAIKPVEQTTIPGKGSVFIISEENYDSIGAAVRRDTATDTIIVSHATIEGKNNCIQFQPKEFFGHMASLVLSYESNGDVTATMLDDSTKHLLWGASWQTFPFASKAQNVQISKKDSTYLNGTHEVKNETASYIGAGSVVVDGNTLLTQKVQVVSIGTKISTIDTLKNWDTTVYTFAPSIGYLVHEEQSAHTVSKSNTSSSSHKSDLIHYTLKQ